MQTTKSNPTKIIITFPGDKSVGIPQCEAVVQFNFDILDDSPGVREKVRAEMANLFEPYSECGELGVRFVDECPDCGQIMDWSVPVGKPEQYRCNNNNCISNHPGDSGNKPAQS
jgi:hypothetical protein